MLCTFIDNNVMLNKRNIIIIGKEHKLGVNQ